MGFSNQEKINIANAALLASVLDANADAVWYEKVFPYQFNLPSEKVWTQLSNIPEARTVSDARGNSVVYGKVIKDYSSPDNALRMTEIPGSNQSTYALYESFNDLTSPIIDNWIQPQQVQQRTGIEIGQPSFGYSIRLFNGDPSNGGSPISPTLGGSGSGANRTVSWFFNYSMGLLLLSSDFFDLTGINKETFDPYIMGFRYVGKTVADGFSRSVVGSFVCDENISVGDVVRIVSPLDNPTHTNVGRIVRAIALSNELNDSEVIGVALEEGVQGSEISVASSGYSDVLFSNPPTDLDVGRKIFLSSINYGKVTTTPPDHAGASVISIGRLLSNEVASSLQDCYINPVHVVNI